MPGAQSRPKEHPMARALTEQDFWARVAFTKPAACAPYTGPGEVLPSGHVRMTFQGRKWLVHRLAWTLRNGPIPPGAYVCHRCIGNPSCVNHLYLGDAATNCADRDALQRRTVVTGVAHHSAKLTERQVRELREARAAGVSIPVLVAEYP